MLWTELPDDTDGDRRGWWEVPGNHPDSFCAKSPYAPASRRPGRWRARGLVLAALAAVVVIVAVVVHLWAGQRPAPPSHDGRLTNRTDLTFTSAGVTSTYHLYAGGLDWTEPVGMMIYADGSGEYGLAHPGSDYLLGGDDGLPEAGAPTRPPGVDDDIDVR